MKCVLGSLDGEAVEIDGEEVFGRRSMREDQIDKVRDRAIKSLFDQGFPVADIAYLFNVSRRTVYNACNRADYAMRLKWSLDKALAEATLN